MKKGNLKVLVVSHLYPNNVNPTYGIFIHRQVDHLAGYGVEIAVVSPTPWCPFFLSFRRRWKDYFKVEKEAQIGRFRVEYPRFFRPPGLWFRPYSGITYYLGVRNMIRDIYRKFPFHLIYSNGLIPDGYASCLLGRDLNLPTICCTIGYDVTGLEMEDMVEKNPNDFSRPYLKKARYVIANSTRIISVSEFIKKRTLDIACPRKEIKAIYRGTDIEMFRPLNTDLELRRKLSFPDNSLVVTFVGSLYKGKGVHDLLNAFSMVASKLPQTYLLIVGDGIERSNLEALSKKMGIEKRVIFAGSVKNEEIPSYYSITDVMAFPSYSEGLPNAVVEAISCGKPVVATNVGGISEVIIPGVNGFLIKVGDIEELYSNIMRILTDRTLMMRLGQEARRIAENCFNGKENAGKLHYFFQEVIEEYEGKVKT